MVVVGPPMVVVVLDGISVLDVVVVVEVVLEKEKLASETSATADDPTAHLNTPLAGTDGRDRPNKISEIGRCRSNGAG